MTRSHDLSMENKRKTEGDNNEYFLNEQTRETTEHENESIAEENNYESVEELSTRNIGKSHQDRSKIDNQIPIVTVQNPTPSPHPPSRNENIEKGEGEEEEEDEEDEEMDYESGEEEEVEEEEVETEMTQEEKMAMYNCVKEGDIDGLEDCLDIPNSDINMTWFQENLLMAAIRAEQTEMAEFLLDNGVDHTFKTSRLVLRETEDGGMKFDRFEVTCRQMAFDHDLHDLVYLIDHLQGKLFSFLPEPKRSPRLRRPRPTTPTDSDIDGGNSSDADVSDSSSHVTQDDERDDRTMTNKSDVETRKRKRRRKRGKKQNESKLVSDGEKYDGEEEEGENDKTAWTGSTFGEVDSGNYSMGSSNKLKKSMVEKHNKLLENGEKVDDMVIDNLDSPRKSVSMAESEKSQVRSHRDRDGNDQNEGDSRSYSTRSKESSAAPEKIQPPIVIHHPPPTSIRLTRSADAIQKSKSLCRFYKSPLNESNIDAPLQWKKVHTAGSYVVESKNWHLDINCTTGNSGSSGSAKKPTNPKVFGASATLEKSLLPSVLVTPSIPTSVTNSSSSSSSKSSPRSSISLVSSSTSTKSILKTKTSLSEDKMSQRSFDSSKPETPIAGYMRPTHSTITKQRLMSSFVNSYGGLDFHHLPTRSQNNKVPNLKTRRPPPQSPKPSSTSPVQTFSYKLPKSKSELQRRNHNTISFRV